VVSHPGAGSGDPAYKIAGGCRPRALTRRRWLNLPALGREPVVERRAEAAFPALDPRLREDDIKWET